MKQPYTIFFTLRIAVPSSPPNVAVESIFIIASVHTEPETNLATFDEKLPEYGMISLVRFAKQSNRP